MVKKKINKVYEKTFKRNREKVQEQKKFKLKEVTKIIWGYRCANPITKDQHGREIRR